MTKHTRGTRYRVQPGEYARQGVFQHKNDHIIWSEETGGEILFFRNGIDRSGVTLGDLKLNPESELNLVNKLLAHYRPHAMPDKQGYYAAAALVTKDMRLFVGINNEIAITNDFEGRGCSETSTHAKVQAALGMTSPEYARVYLMSGKAVKDNGKLKEEHPHHVACLCGECRRNVRDNVDDQSQFIILPTNDGSATLTLNHTAKSQKELKANEAWVISKGMMYPIPKSQTITANFNTMVMAGYDLLLKKDQEAPLLQTRFDAWLEQSADAQGKLMINEDDVRALVKSYAKVGLSVDALKENPSHTNINRSLVQLVKKAYDFHREHIPKDKNLEVTATIIKTERGEYYPSIYVNGEKWLPSKPSPTPAALSNAFNEVAVEEIFVMHANDAQLRGEQATLSEESEGGHAIPNLDPAMLGRLLKNCKNNQDVKIHLVPLNNGLLSAEELKIAMIIRLAREDFGPDFAGPKQQARELG